MKYLGIIEESIKNHKKFSYDDGKISYCYNGVNYTITIYTNWNSRFGDHINLRCDFIKNFSITMRQHSWDEVSIISTSLEKNNAIINKLNVLAKRIKDQVKINEHHNIVESEFSPRIVDFIKKRIGEPNLDIKIHISENWYNYRTYKNKLVRELTCFIFSAKVRIDNRRFVYRFEGFYPSDWSPGSTTTKKILLTSDSEFYDKPIQITNRIRYAKLKNIFNE